ncbi:MAG: ABC transporter permease [Defluviitaleaceae bacterium]|nr:ABC transporter permease [Defluviitaleaceae bacterium]MCL2240512.1 ABC transporter permease [Defluviitaleaceae bacterium]
MYKSYLLFELKRQFSSLKTIVITAIFLLGLAGYLSYSVYMHRDAHERHIESLRAIEAYLPNLTAVIRAAQQHEGLTISIERTADETAAILTMLSEDVRRVSAQRIHADTYLPGEEVPAWERVLNAHVLRHERLLANFYAWRMVRAAYLGVCATEIDFNDPTMEAIYRLRYTETQLMTTIQFYRYLQNVGVPIIHSAYEPTAFQLAHRIISTLGAFILPILVVLLVADVFSKENEVGGYKVLLLQPLSRMKVYLAKLCSSFIVCVTAFVLPMALISSIAGIVFGLGLGGYPVPFAPAQMQPATYYETAAQVLARLDPGYIVPDGFIAVSQYLLWGLPFVLIFLLFAVSLTTFISMTARDSVFSMAVGFGIVLGSLVLTAFGFGRVLWNPIIYADMDYIVTSGNAGLFWYPLLWAAILIIVGFLWFRKKDVIC